jgi:hypothetical protein
MASGGLLVTFSKSSSCTGPSTHGHWRRSACWKPVTERIDISASSIYFPTVRFDAALTNAFEHVVRAGTNRLDILLRESAFRIRSSRWHMPRHPLPANRDQPLNTCSLLLLEEADMFSSFLCSTSTLRVTLSYIQIYVGNSMNFAGNLFPLLADCIAGRKGCDSIRFIAWHS